jgi:hypothetical protein
MGLREPISPSVLRAWIYLFEGRTIIRAEKFISQKLKGFMPLHNEGNGTEQRNEKPMNNWEKLILHIFVWLSGYQVWREQQPDSKLLFTLDISVLKMLPTMLRIWLDITRPAASQILLGGILKQFTYFETSPLFRNKFVLSKESTYFVITFCCETTSSEKAIVHGLLSQSTFKISI